MTSDYVFRLLVMLPLVLALIVGGLWLAKRVMAMQGKQARTRGSLRISETLFLSPGNRLAVIDFADKRLLVAVTKTNISLLSQSDSFVLPEPEAKNAI